MVFKNCSFDLFASEIGQKMIICYGIGKDFTRIMDSYKDYDWVGRITALVDGNEKRKEESIRVNGREYKVFSEELLLHVDTSKVVLLITCTAYKEIKEKLDSISRFDSLECYIFYYMVNAWNGTKLTIRRTNEPLIPKKIHYCWFGNEGLSDNVLRCIESWRKNCPDYEIIRWDENNCDISDLQYTKEAYRAKKYAFVSDYFRLKALYEEGGIYLDTDVEVIRSLDDLRYNKAFAGLEEPWVIATGLGCGCVKHFAIIKEFMDYYKGARFLKEDGSYDMTSCPLIQTGIMLKHGFEPKNRLVEIDGMTIYPVEVFAPKNMYTLETTITDNTYSIHHYDASWLK